MRTLKQPEYRDGHPTFNELEPWMIGQVVEVGVYKKNGTEPGARTMQMVGVLQSFGTVEHTNRSFVTLEGASEFNRAAWDFGQHVVLVTVIVEPA